MNAPPLPDPAGWSRARVAAATAALAVLVALPYLQVVGFEFVVCDDPEYVYENPAVLRGLGAHSLSYAFGAAHVANWHPLTWLSHMLDCAWFASADPAAAASGGQWAGGHHLVSVLVHVAATVLAFAVLRQFPIAPGAAFLVAALFGLHPQHVESVAWVAERKDVLSGLFWFATMGAWLGWVRRPTRWRYLAVAALLAAGLLSKAMVVTLPCVLLLLDHWPLRRWQRPGDFGRLVAEKLPLFAMVVAVAVVTVRSQAAAGSMRTIDSLPLLVRFANAADAWLDYLVRTVWPVDLAIFYPHPYLAAGGWTTAFVVQSLVGGAAVVGLVVGAWRLRHAEPWLLFGLLWYLGTLVPVIGIVQVGAQASADRYTYLPLVGVFLAATVSAAEWWRRRGAGRWRPGPPAALAAAVVLACGVATVRQVATWRADATLFAHAIAAVPGNYLAHNHLGLGLYRRGELAAAAAEFDRAIAIRPDYAWALNNRAACALASRDFATAADLLRRALAVDPGYADAWNNLGSVEFLQRRYTAALPHYERAVATLRSERVDHRLNLGLVCEKLGRRDDALRHYAMVLAAAPAHAMAAHRAGLVMLAAGRVDAAAAGFERMRAAQPRAAEAWHGLARVAIRRGGLDEAERLLRTALDLRPAFGEAHRDLAGVLLRRGAWADAVRHAEQAIAGDGPDPEVHLASAAALARAGESARARAHLLDAQRLLVTQEPASPPLAEAVARALAALAAGRPPEVPDLLR